MTGSGRWPFWRGVKRSICIRRGPRWRPSRFWSWSSWIRPFWIARWSSLQSFFVYYWYFSKYLLYLLYPLSYSLLFCSVFTYFIFILFIYLSYCLFLFIPYCHTHLHNLPSYIFIILFCFIFIFCLILLLLYSF